MTDLQTITQRLKLFTSDGVESPAFFDAIVGDPIITSTIMGSSSITVTVSDPDRVFLPQVDSPEDDAKAYAVLDDEFAFPLAIIRKNGDNLTLVYEDAIIGSLRLHTDRITLKPGSTTFPDFVSRLADEATVLVDLDSTDAFPASVQLGRSLGDTTTNSWQVLSGLARSQGWRCFSDWTQLVIGTDDWLFTREATPLQVSELEYPVFGIDFDVAPNMTTHSCRLRVATQDFSCVPGQLVQVTDEGPHEGLWIVAKWVRGLTQQSASVVTLIRPGEATGPVFHWDDQIHQLPTAIPNETQVGEVVTVHGSEIYVTVIGGDKNHPLGPCRGIKTGVKPGQMVLIVQTPQGPWITAVDS